MSALSPASRRVFDLLSRYQPQGADEVADTGRTLAVVSQAGDPWLRSIPLHVTASALIVHPPTGQVLLRWHERQQAWLQVGGHGDPGEHDALAIALREGQEETGLTDLVPYPDGRLRHVVIVSVPPGKGEPAHEHADLRFVLATADPSAAKAENDEAPLRWLTVPDALGLITEANLREFLTRVAALMNSAGR